MAQLIADNPHANPSEKPAPAPQIPTSGTVGLPFLGYCAGAALPMRTWLTAQGGLEGIALH